ncbi:hypothetical protein Hdeb2414_s0012g00397201 [Helianthus debilis subsp. tardiflorus]
MMFFQQGDRNWLHNQLEPMNHIYVSMPLCVQFKEIGVLFVVLVRYIFVSMMKNG